MKFGKLYRATIDARMPQWDAHMVHYKNLKRAIQQALEARAADPSRPAEQLLEHFTQLLDVEVARVNDFYMDRIEEGVIILTALQQQGEVILATTAARSGVSLAEQRHKCKQSLVTFHLNLLILQNFVALNFMAIAKILKKWDKRTQLPLRTEYIGAIVELPFYQCQSLGQLVEGVESAFAVLDKNPAPSQSHTNACHLSAHGSEQWTTSQQLQQPQQHATHTIS
ncbi:hypothetical protein AB1Y20_015830 [Prymnesium parvum]